MARTLNVDINILVGLLKHSYHLFRIYFKYLRRIVVDTYIRRILNNQLLASEIGNIIKYYTLFPLTIKVELIVTNVICAITLNFKY